MTKDTWRDRSMLETYFAVMWNEVQKQLPKSVERAALGDAKIATAMKASIFQVLPIIIDKAVRGERERIIEAIKNTIGINTNTAGEDMRLEKTFSGSGLMAYADVKEYINKVDLVRIINNLK